MDEDVLRDWAWAKQFEAEIMEITTRELSAHLMTTTRASHFEDTKNATDFVVMPTIPDVGRVAARVRRAHYTYRDLTIRAWRSSGIKTELAKILEGLVDYYFYGWTKYPHKIEHWMLVDLKRLRDESITRILHWATQKPNYDNKTAFIHIPIVHLFMCGCVIANNEDVQKKEEGKKCHRCESVENYVIYVGDKETCVKCAVELQNEADEQSWLKVETRPVSKTKIIEQGPYQGFYTCDSEVDPARREKCLEDARNFKAKS